MLSVPVTYPILEVSYIFKALEGEKFQIDDCDIQQHTYRQHMFAKLFLNLQP